MGKGSRGGRSGGGRSSSSGRSSFGSSRRSNFGSSRSSFGAHRHASSFGAHRHASSFGGHHLSFGRSMIGRSHMSTGGRSSFGHNNSRRSTGRSHKIGFKSTWSSQSITYGRRYNRVKGILTRRRNRRLNGGVGPPDPIGFLMCCVGGKVIKLKQNDRDIGNLQAAQTELLTRNQRQQHLQYFHQLPLDQKVLMLLRRQQLLLNDQEVLQLAQVWQARYQYMTQLPLEVLIECWLEEQHVIEQLPADRQIHIMQAQNQPIEQQLPIQQTQTQQPIQPYQPGQALQHQQPAVGQQFQTQQGNMWSTGQTQFIQPSANPQSQMLATEQPQYGHQPANQQNQAWSKQQQPPGAPPSYQQAQMLQTIEERPSNQQQAPGQPAQQQSQAVLLGDNTIATEVKELQEAQTELMYDIVAQQASEEVADRLQRLKDQQNRLTKQMRDLEAGGFQYPNGIPAATSLAHGDLMSVAEIQ